MMSNNWQRLGIWLNLVNKFDYAEFTTACKSQGVTPQPSLEFAQKAGMLSCGITKYPELLPQDAYLKFIEDNQQVNYVQESITHINQDTSNVGCTTCGSTVVTQSRGVGDTIAKITHATGIDKLAELYTKITGQPCGCASRQEALNKLLPYNIKEEN